MENTTVARLRECTAAVLEHAEIRDVRVVRLLCEGATPIQEGPFEVESNLSVRANLADSALYSFSLYEVAASTKDGDEAWSVKLEVVGEWDLTPPDSKFDEEHLSCFAIAIGSMTLHPYARENVQSAVSRMGYPPFTLDMLHPTTAGHDEDVVEISSSLSSDFSFSDTQDRT